MALLGATVECPPGPKYATEADILDMEIVRGKVRLIPNGGADPEYKGE